MSMPSYTLRELAEALGLSLQGDNGDLVITGLNTLEEAGPTEVSFLANPKYIKQLTETRAGAIIVRAEHAADVGTALISEDPYLSFAQAMGLFAVPQGCFTGQSPLASIHPEANIAPDCTIYPFAYVAARATIGPGCILFPGVYVGEDCQVGAQCTLYPHAVLMSGTILGNHCVLQPGAVIGAEGFGFIRTPVGIQKIPQIGVATLGDKVEVGVNSAIDRAALSTTAVDDGTCIDNLVQIGHNVRVGKDCLIISQVGISGSTKVGDNVTMAGQVGVAGHLNIGHDVTIGPQAGVAKDIAPGQVVGGHPTMDYSTYLRTMSLTPRLPELFKRLAKVEKELAAFKDKS